MKAKKAIILLRRCVSLMSLAQQGEFIEPGTFVTKILARAEKIGSEFKEMKYGTQSAKLTKLEDDFTADDDDSASQDDDDDAENLAGLEQGARARVAEGVTKMDARERKPLGIGRPLGGGKQERVTGNAEDDEHAGGVE